MDIAIARFFRMLRRFDDPERQEELARRFVQVVRRVEGREAHHTLRRVLYHMERSSIPALTSLKEELRRELEHVQQTWR